MQYNLVQRLAGFYQKTSQRLLSGETTSLCKSKLHSVAYSSTLVAYSDHKMESNDTIKLICQFKNKEAEIGFQVIEKDLLAILKRSACTDLGLVWRIYNVVCDENTDVLKKFDDVFNEKKIKIEFIRIESLGVIEKQTELTEWVNSMVTIVKHSKLCICIDPKDLNKA